MGEACPPTPVRTPPRGISIYTGRTRRLPAIAPLTGPLGGILKQVTRVVRRSLAEASAQRASFGPVPYIGPWNGGLPAQPMGSPTRRLSSLVSMSGGQWIAWLD
jgi:hypothetical protein